jgi:hypothetical protein
MRLNATDMCLRKMSTLFGLACSRLVIEKNENGCVKLRPSLSPSSNEMRSLKMYR